MATAATFYVSQITCDSATLRIELGDGYSKFRIFCRTDGGTTVKDATVTRTADFSYTITGLSPSTAYVVNVCSIPASGQDGQWAGSESFTTDIAPARPTNWSWWSVVSKGKPIGISASEWNAFCVRINEFRDYSGLAQYGAFVTARPGADISAAIVNHAVWAIGAMNSGAYALEVVPGGTVSAKFFNGLKNHLNGIA